MTNYFEMNYTFSTDFCELVLFSLVSSEVVIYLAILVFYHRALLCHCMSFWALLLRAYRWRYMVSYAWNVPCESFFIKPINQPRLKNKGFFMNIADGRCFTVGIVNLGSYLPDGLGSSDFQRDFSGKYEDTFLQNRTLVHCSITQERFLSKV